MFTNVFISCLCWAWNLSWDVSPSAVLPLLCRESSKRDFDELWICAKEKKKKLWWYLYMTVMFLSSFLLNGTELVPSN